MALLVDKARDALKSETGATATFVQPTPRTYPRTFGIKASVIDNHVATLDTDGTKVAPVAVAQAAYPAVDLSAFWLAKVSKTRRLFT